MKLTNDHKVQIFCAALSAIIQAEAAVAVASGPNIGSGIGAKSPVEKASVIASEAIVTLQSKEWSTDASNVGFH